MIHKLKILLAVAILCAACGVEPEPTMLPPGDGVRLPAPEEVRANQSAVVWIGSGTFTNGHIFCGPGGTVGWYPMQTVYQTVHLPFPTFSTHFYAWGAYSGIVNYNLMVLVCPDIVNLYSGGDGGWYNHVPLTSCSVYTKHAGVKDYTLDSVVSVQAYNAVYYPATEPNGGWGVVIDWNGGGGGTHDLWNSCGFPDGTSESLWYEFYSPS